jgi:hypothetical protein
MRLRLRFPLAAAAAVVLAAAAAADPFTPHFQPLLAEMNQRDGALPLTGLTREQRKQRSALNRAYRALEADSTDLAGDLKMSLKMTKALEKGFPGDPEFGPLLDALHAALGGLAADGRDELEVAIAGLAEGKYRDRATAKLAKADAILLLAAEAETRVRRAAFQRKCWTVVLQGGKIVAKAAPGGPSGDSTVAATVDGSAWASNAQFGTAVVGLANVSASTGGLRKVLFTGRRILPHSADDDLPGETTRLQIMLSSIWADVAPGTYSVGGAEGVSVSATWTFEDEDGNATQAVALAGSVTIATTEVLLGSVSATGTFEFTMYDGVAGDSFPIASGTFDAFDLPRSDLP